MPAPTRHLVSYRASSENPATARRKRRSTCCSRCASGSPKPSRPRLCSTPGRSARCTRPGCRWPVLRVTGGNQQRQRAYGVERGVRRRAHGRGRENCRFAVMPRTNEKARDRPERRTVETPKPDESPAEKLRDDPSRASRVRSTGRGGRGRYVPDLGLSATVGSRGRAPPPSAGRRSEPGNDPTDLNRTVALGVARLPLNDQSPAVCRALLSTATGIRRRSATALQSQIWLWLWIMDRWERLRTAGADGAVDDFLTIRGGSAARVAR